VVQPVGADGDPDGHLLPGAVIPDLELEGVIQAPLEVLGQPGNSKRELRQRCEQAGIGRAGLVLVLGEPGEFVGLGAMLGDQIDEPALDGLPVRVTGTSSPAVPVFTQVFATCSSSRRAGPTECA